MHEYDVAFELGSYSVFVKLEGRHEPACTQGDPTYTPVNTTVPMISYESTRGPLVHRCPDFTLLAYLCGVSMYKSEAFSSRAVLRNPRRHLKENLLVVKSVFVIRRCLLQTLMSSCQEGE